MKKLVLLLLACSFSLGEVVISPNMSLPVPVVSQTLGPAWATDINACMSSIDQHDHTPGKGVPISSQAININAALPLNNNPLTQVQAVEFSSQTSFSPTQSLYVESPDLFYNDGNGNIIRITQAGSVAGAAGTITGLPSGTASASYQSVGGTFQFQSATNTPANGSFASLTIAQQTVTPNGITLKSPNSLAASYNVIFPTGLPAYTSLLTMGTSGILSTVPYAVPTQTRFTSGTATYTVPAGPAPIYLRIRMVGGGGGGGGAGGGAGAGGTGGTSTLGSSILTCAGGVGGQPNVANGGAGGTATIAGSGVFGLALQGANGTGGQGGSGAGAVNGGAGASSPLGGAGGGGYNEHNGSSAVANSGSGGGGGGSTASGDSGAGGGAGGWIEAYVTGTTLSTWIATPPTYAVGTFGTFGTPGGGGNNGGVGSTGYIEITEIYQ